jgi:acyl carrier protein
MNIEDEIRTYIVGAAGMTRPPGDDDPLITHGFVPSVRLLDLVGFLEDTYEIRLRPVDLVPENLATIGKMAAVVRHRLKDPSRARPGSG